MRWFLYLVLYIPVQLFTYLITPLLPFVAGQRVGKSDNANSESVGPRLPLWLSYFDTPDNSLLGDSGWAANHSGGYWSKVSWLYRNSLYGFKWSVLACDMDLDRTIKGNLNINYHTKTYGSFHILQNNDYWQYKIVKPFLGMILILNIGWLLDDTSQPRALFMLSSRLKKG